MNTLLNYGVKFAKTCQHDIFEELNLFQSQMTSKKDWRNFTTMNGCLSQICMTETLADVFFVFPSRGGHDDTIPAHKFILSLRSPVFENMFYGPSSESSGPIMIRDIRATTFRILLKYMYTDGVDFDGNTVLHVLYAAKKYQLDGLITECETYLQTAIDVDNACSMYNQSSFYEMDLLQAACLDFICMNANDIFDNDDFLKLTPQSLIEILSAGGLGVEEELDVFNAAVKWASHHCKKKGFEPTSSNMRAWLGEGLFRIRLPIIPVADFTDSVVSTGLLTQEEQVQLYKHMTVHRNPDLDEDVVDSVGKFDARHRPGSVFELKLPISDPKNIKKCLTAACQIILVADKPLRLRRISLFYSEHQYQQNISVTITNLKDKSCEKPELEPVGPKGPLCFKRGVYICANTEYDILVNCMVYRGDVKAMELTNTYRGVLVSVSSVFNSMESLHLSRTHSPS